MHTAECVLIRWNTINIGIDKHNFEHKFENIFLPISFNICLGAQKNCLIKTVLLSTHNICFDLEIRNNFLICTL